MSAHPGTTPPDPAFEAAYERALAAWPVPVAERDVSTPFGSTHVLAAGADDGPPVVLLPGGGATATVWGPLAGPLVAAGLRVLAVDPLTDAGRSTGPGPRTLVDVVGWWTALLDGLQVERARVVGHSYGAWTATHVSLAVPARTGRLALLDPTDVVAGPAPAYVLRALPLLLRPRADRATGLLTWETRGQQLDPTWTDVFAAGVTQRRHVVRPRRPPRQLLGALDVPVLALVADLSRAHDPRRVSRRLATALPAATVTLLPGASHHTLPGLPADAVAAQLVPFLTA